MISRRIRASRPQQKSSGNWWTWKQYFGLKFLRIFLTTFDQLLFLFDGEWPEVTEKIRRHSDHEYSFQGSSISGISLPDVVIFSWVSSQFQRNPVVSWVWNYRAGIIFFLFKVFILSFLKCFSVTYRCFNSEFFGKYD